MSTKSESKSQPATTTAATNSDLLDRIAEATMEAAKPMEVDDLIAQRKRIEDIMAQVMKVDVHYGTIPGTNKPTLLQPGAQLLCNVFRMEPRQEYTEVYTEQYDDNTHLTINARTTLYQVGTGIRLGDGMGMATTLESRYRYRNAKRTCPQCNKTTIIKGKEEYGGGWLCWKKEGKSDGCGAKFQDGDSAIEDQAQGKVDNPDIADQYNTVTKMALKRSLVYAVLNVLAASDMFTQDIEDMPRDEPANKGTNGKPTGSAKPDEDSKRLDGQVNKLVGRINKETTVDGLKGLWEKVKDEVEGLPKERSGFICGNFNRRKTEIGATATKTEAKPAEKSKYANIGEEVVVALRSITEATDKADLDKRMNDLNDLRDRLVKKKTAAMTTLNNSITTAYATAKERIENEPAGGDDWLADGEENAPDGDQ